MSFTKDEIVARLQKGETLDDIAKEIASALNDAQTEYVNQKNAEEEKKNAEARVYGDKVEAIMTILSGLCDYCIAAGEEDMVQDIREVEADTVIEMLDSAIKMTKDMEKLKNLEFKGNPFDVFRGFWL